MKIAILGIGYVGAVTAACLARDGHDVVAVDIDAHKVERLRYGLSPIVEPGLESLIGRGVAAGQLRATTDTANAIRDTDLSFICVGTPSLPDGGLNLDYVVRVCEEIGAALRARESYHAVVVRSTMLPGSTNAVVIPALECASGKRAGIDFGVAVCPEFLREGSAIRDFGEGGSLIVGTTEDRVAALLQQVVPAGGPAVTVTGLGTAEALKYANNAWHAVKVVFANEIGNLCDAVGVDGLQVMDLLCADHRLNISPAYMRPGFAYGGSCLPKDLNALLHRARQAHLRCPLLEAAPASNDRQIRRVFDLVCASGRKRVGLIGLSFKNGTDDLRDSPAVELAERLFGKGYDIKIFDRDVSIARLNGANLAFIEARLPHLAALLCDDIDEVTRHGDTLVITRSDGPASAASLRRDDDQTIIDLCGVMRDQEVRHNAR